MKTLDLNAYGVSEMTHQEMVETDGGSLLVIGVILLVGVVAASCTYAPDNRQYTTNVIVATDSARVNQTNVDANLSVLPKK